MRILADESVERQVVDRLRKDGHDVMYVMEMGRGISDEKVLSLARQKDALLLTLDKDFGELVFRKMLISRGVVLLRLMGCSITEKNSIISNALRQYGEEMAGAFSVVARRSIRIRKTVLPEEE